MAANEVETPNTKSAPVPFSSPVKASRSASSSAASAPSSAPASSVTDSEQHSSTAVHSDSDEGEKAKKKVCLTAFVPASVFLAALFCYTDRTRLEASSD